MGVEKIKPHIRKKILKLKNYKNPNAINGILIKHHTLGNSYILAPYCKVYNKPNVAPNISCKLVKRVCLTSNAGINHIHKYIK